MTFAELPVHDAVFAGVLFEWAEARCICKVDPVGLEPHELVFSQVRELHVPRNELWGPSKSVNGTREEAPGVFLIELQSGDVLRIVAESWEFRREQTNDAP